MSVFDTIMDCRVTFSSQTDVQVQCSKGDSKCEPVSAAYHPRFARFGAHMPCRVAIECCRLPNATRTV